MLMFILYFISQNTPEVNAEKHDLILVQRVEDQWVIDQTATDSYAQQWTRVKHSNKNIRFR